MSRVRSSLTIMRTIDGINDGEIDITEDTHVSGVWRGYITIKPGGYLDFDGALQGGITVENTGKAEFDGILEGSVVVLTGGDLNVSGALRGAVDINDGRLTVTAGTAVAESADAFTAQRVLDDGSLGSAAEDGPRTSRAMRLQVRGTGSELTFEPLR